MKKLYTLTAAAGVLLALAGPTVAAQRAHRAADSYASGAPLTDRSGSYYYGPRDAQGRAIAVQQQAVAPQFDRGQNAPFADRPYGNPGTW